MGTATTVTRFGGFMATNFQDSMGPVVARRHWQYRCRTAVWIKRQAEREAAAATGANLKTIERLCAVASRIHFSVYGLWRRVCTSTIISIRCNWKCKFWGCILDPVKLWLLVKSVAQAVLIVLLRRMRDICGKCDQVSNRAQRLCDIQLPFVLYFQGIMCCHTFAPGVALWMGVRSRKAGRLPCIMLTIFF